MRAMLMFLVVTILMATAVTAMAGTSEAPIPALNGAPTHTRWSIDDPRSFVDQRYIRSELAQRFPDLVRMLGGRHVNGEPRYGQRVLLFAASTEIPNPRGLGVNVGWWGGSIGGYRGKMTVNMTATLYRVDKNGGWSPICTRYARGESSLSGIAVDNLPVGRIGWQDIRVNFGQAKPMAKAEIAAYRQAIFAFTERPLRQTAKYEPIAVISANGDTVVISGGTDRGIREGDTFFVFRKDVHRTNPNTDEVLDEEVASLGVIRVNSVKPRVSYCEIIDGDIEKLTAGDRVVKDSTPRNVRLTAPKIATRTPVQAAPKIASARPARVATPKEPEHETSLVAPDNPNM